jgi:biotin operon repressor
MSEPINVQVARAIKARQALATCNTSQLCRATGIARTVLQEQVDSLRYRGFVVDISKNTAHLYRLTAEGVAWLAEVTR